MGFYSVRDIEVGHEVVWDYGVKGEEWSGCQLMEGVVVEETEGGDGKPLGA